MTSVNDFTDATFRLSGAWLPGDTNDPVFPIGSGYRHDHQREMFDYINDDQHDVVLNTNPTGGGKTLSWGAPVIRSNEFNEFPMEVIAAYPTAALVEDQRQTLLDLFEQYFGSTDPQWAASREYDLAVTLDGEKVLTNGTNEYLLEERVVSITAATTQGERTSEIWTEMHQNAAQAKLDGLPTILLTTPDTLTLMAANRFQDRANIASIPGDVDMIVVDEFHLANPRGKRLLPFHLDTYLSIGDSNLDKLVFLSATPVSSDISRLENAFNIAKVTDDVHASDLGVPNWKIMPETEFGVISRPMFSSGYWVEANIDKVIDYHEAPGQTLIVVDSIREVELIKAALEREAPQLDVGQVYGWKKEGRQEAIDNSDILVGNTAVEVGVDFQKINRLIFTAYDPNAALQRLGRMRARSQFSDYEALLITNPTTQSELIANTTNGRMTRTVLDKVLHRALAERVDRPYYDSLCGAYTRYLLEDAPQPLKSEFRPTEVDLFKELSHNHFGPSLQGLFGKGANQDSFWQYLGVFKNKYKTGHNDYPIFEEMHTYRADSLSCLVIDATDTEEPLKRYSLHHILRHRKGSVIELDRVEDVFNRHFNRAPTDDEQWFIDDSLRHVCAAFFVTGELDDPRDYTLRDYRFEEVKRKEWKANNMCLPGELKDPKAKVDPIVNGQKHLDIGDTGVIAQYVPCSVSNIHGEFSLGPYASACPVGTNESLLLWQDAILAHSKIMERKLRQKGGKSTSQQPIQSSP